MKRRMFCTVLSAIACAVSARPAFGSHTEKPLLIPPEATARPQPDMPRSVAGVPLPRPPDPQGAPSISMPLGRDPISYIFPGRIVPMNPGYGVKTVTAVDLDRDGILDLATVENGSRLAIRYGRSDGTFDLPDWTHAVSSANWVAAGHFNADALPDLVVIENPGELRITLFLAEPDGGFTATVSYPTGGGYAYVVTGDFDADGFSDVATSDGRLRRGMGNGTLGAAEFTHATGGNGSYYPTLAVGDMNGDAVDDLVGIGSPSNQGWIMYGRAGLGLGAASEYPIPSGVRQILVGDYNGDGRRDVAVPSSSAGISVFYTQDDGTLGERHDYSVSPAFSGYYTVRSGDTDGDGRDDLIAQENEANGNWARFRTFHGQQGGGFRAVASLLWNPTILPKAFITADVDRDGRAEVLLVGNSGELATWDYHRVRNQVVVRSDIVVSPATARRGLAVADLDADGFPDLALTDTNRNEVRIMWGDGTGAFSLDEAVYPLTAPWRIAVGDLDDDGLPDLAVSTTSGVLRILYQVAPRAFNAPADYTVGTGRAGVVVAHFNDDEFLDVAAGGKVLLGQGDGTLGGEISIGVIGEIVAADFDWDGWIDIGGRYGDRGLGVVYNQAGTGFTEPQGVQLSQPPSTLAAGDYNGDGTLDLAAWLGNGGTTSVAVLYGLEAGGFVEPPELHGPFTNIPDPQAITAADFNRDGYEDLCIYTYVHATLLLGSDSNPLADMRHYAVRSSLYAAATSDLDGDGRLDLIGLEGGTVVSVYMNQDLHKATGDLVAEAMIGPANGMAGQVADVTWTVCNSLDRPLTAKWVDGVYLSRDEAWDINDRALGTLEYVGTLAAAGDPDGNDCYTREASVLLPAVSAGAYYLLVRADTYDDIREIDGEDDNIATAAITVTVPELPACPPGTPPEECLGLDDEFVHRRQAKLYKIEVTADEDLLVTLDAASAGGINELYIRYEYPATRVSYDDKYDTPFAPDQTVRIPGTQAGTYYILAYADKMPSEGVTEFNLRAEYQPFEITAVTPDEGGNVGQLTTKLTGSHLTPGTTVTLIGVDSQAHDALAVYFETMATIYATFDLMSLEPGEYDVQIEDGAVRTLTNALTVVAGGGPVFGARLSTPDVARADQEFAFFIDLWNSGNTDAILPILLISGSNPIWVPDSPSDPSDYVTVTGFWPGPADLMSSGVHTRVEMRSSAPNQISIMFAAARSHAASSWLNWFKDRLVDIMLAISHGQIDNVLGPVIQVVANEDLGCHVLAFMLAENRARISELANIVEDPLFPEKEAALHDIHSALVAAWNAAGCDGDDGTVTVVTSSDPNDKLSPHGWGGDKFVPEGYTIPYTIRFENLPAATAAALKVEVTDQLHEDLAWETLALDEIGLGETAIQLPPGLTHYEGRIEIDGWTWDETAGMWVRYDGDETPLVPLVVDVAAGIDIETGVVHWSIDCADRNTGTWPEDPYAGFLPPNQEAIFYPDPSDPNDPPRMIHPGEGYLTYSVAPIEGLATGTEITNMASIVFDWNAAIETPEVLNTIDAGPPASEVATLPAEVNHASFEVCWSGEDDLGGCGVESFTIYVSDDNGPYTAWLVSEEECGLFAGAAVGHTYSFYSVGRDHLGHVELPPTDAEDETVIVPDATTTVRFGDFDDNGVVDLVDYDAFEMCITGAGAGPPDPGCEAKDFDLDGDVDLTDFASFQVAFGESQ